MTNEEKKKAIESYIAAYNDFDIEGMIDLIHPEIVFENVVGDEVNARTVGVEEFRDLANKAKTLFSSRRQKVTNFKFTDEVASVDIAYEAILASDLPNGMKTGESLQLHGRSEFEFKDGKIIRLTDFS